MRMLPFLLSLLALSLHARAEDWPQFLGPSRNGSWQGPPLTTSWPKEGPKRLWKRDVGEGFSGPVAREGRLILFHRQDNQERVDCLNATNGQPIWSAEYPSRYRDDFGFDEGPRATPALDKNRVYTFGADGQLACWDFSSGQSLWKVDTLKEYHSDKGYFGRVCSPLVESERVILNLGGAKGAGIVAFDGQTGKELWRATDDSASYSSPVAATLGGKRQVFVLTRSELVCLDPGNGHLRFRYPWRPAIQASVTAATPLVIGDLLFISASYDTGAAVLEFHPEDPKVLWKREDVLSNHYATAVHHDGFLYGYDGRQEEGCNLRCVDLRTGQVRWSQDRFGAGTVTLANDLLLLLSEKGELIEAQPSPLAFSELQRAQILGFQTRAYPALAGGLFYARDKRQLVCVDLR